MDENEDEGRQRRMGSVEAFASMKEGGPMKEQSQKRHTVVGTLKPYDRDKKNAAVIS